MFLSGSSALRLSVCAAVIQSAETYGGCHIGPPRRLCSPSGFAGELSYSVKKRWDQNMVNENAVSLGGSANNSAKRYKKETLVTYSCHVVIYPPFPPSEQPLYHAEHFGKICVITPATYNDSRSPVKCMTSPVVPRSKDFTLRISVRSYN